jgi:hypothetical protein
MRREPIKDVSVWRAADLAADQGWVLDLNPDDQAEILLALAHVRRLALDHIDRDNFILPVLGPRLDAVIDEIEGGRGVSLIRGVPIEGLALPELEKLFWGLSCHIGHPEPQDGGGRRLHHVRAEQAFASKAAADAAFQASNLRGYQTNIELQFHGDGSDVLFFLCRRAGRSGGLSRVASAATAFNAVLARDPALAAALQQPFWFDVRGELGPDRPCQVAPIFSWYEGRLSMLYKRGYIALAQRLPGVPPLTALQVAAMDALDEALAAPGAAYEFMMRPGDIEIANNYNVLHARTAFVDHDEPEQRRHMLRIWSTLRRNRRPLPPALRETREFRASWRRLALGDAGWATRLGAD